MGSCLLCITAQHEQCISTVYDNRHLDWSIDCMALWAVIRKTFWVQMKSMRFLLPLGAVVLVTALGAVVSLEQLSLKRSTIQLREQEVRAAHRQANVYNQTAATLLLSPSGMDFLCSGVSSRLGNEIIMPGVLGAVLVTSYSALPNPYVPAGEIDISRIVALVLTLMALLLTYDGIAEQGDGARLRTVFSYPVRRAVVVAGLYVGTVVILFVAVVAVLATWALARLAAGDGLSLPDLSSIGLAMVASLLTLSAFAWLGLTISSYSGTSQRALSISLVVWAMLVVLLPVLFTGGLSVATRPTPEHKLQAHVQDSIATALSADGRTSGSTTGWVRTFSDQTLARSSLSALEVGEYNRLSRTLQPPAVAVLATPVLALDGILSGLARTDLDTHRDFVQHGMRLQSEVISWQRTGLRANPSRMNRLTDKDKPLDWRGYPQEIIYSPPQRGLAAMCTKVLVPTGALVFWNVVLALSTLMGVERRIV